MTDNTKSESPINKAPHSPLKKTTHPGACVPPPSGPILEQMLGLRNDVLQKEKSAAKLLQNIHPDHLRSAKNLVQYLAFRTHDLRDLQLLLTDSSLSSLGRAERKVQATLDGVIRNLHHFSGKKWQPVEHPPFCFEEGRRMLEENSERLLGRPTDGRRVRIMVTMPTEAAENYDLVKNLMDKGMNCARINCAHDEPVVWQKIIANIRKAEDSLERKCKILMDLGGPKLRTGNLEAQPTALKVRPHRNALGEVVAASQIWLFAENSSQKPKKEKILVPQTAGAAFPMPADWLEKLKVGDQIALKDARGARRKLKILAASKQGCLATCRKTIYFRSGLTFKILRKKELAKKSKARLVMDLPADRSALRLAIGDQLLLTRSQAPGHNAELDAEGNVTSPATIPCSLPEVFEDVKTGEPIWFDDGKIGGTIEKTDPKQLTVRIAQTPPLGGFLRSEKGINLPETELQLHAITAQDKADLKFIVKNADMVGLSFANRPEDVQELVAEMKKIHPQIPAVVLKIETQLGFKNLPAMLLAAMQAPSCGVMIARGDLAIECGFGRLSEVQEQVLWTCEAAHVPVIWATQVLEGLAKTGLPTRAEVTDAAMGQRAECIMLNKGPHIVAATQALGDILGRMQDHQTKKRSLLRKLRLAERFFEKI